MDDLYFKAIFAAVASVAMFMEVFAKPALKTALPALLARVPFLPNFPEAEKVKWTFRGIAIGAGIVVTAFIYTDASLSRWLGFFPSETWLDYFDIVVTGALIGLGEKQAHDIMDALWDVVKGSDNA